MRAGRDGWIKGEGRDEIADTQDAAPIYEANFSNCQGSTISGYQVCSAASALRKAVCLTPVLEEIRPAIASLGGPGSAGA